jgi:hypothetical protein
MRCHMPSVCCDCGGYGCGCSGCATCQRCEACNADEVYCHTRKKWYSLVCDNDHTPVDPIIELADGQLVYDE